MDAMTWEEFRRRYYPHLRRQGPVGIVRNGPSRRVYGCICGATISMCARWPVTKRVWDFIAAHKDCRPLPEAES